MLQAANTDRFNPLVTIVSAKRGRVQLCRTFYKNGEACVIVSRDPNAYCLLRNCVAYAT